MPPFSERAPTPPKEEEEEMWQEMITKMNNNDEVEIGTNVQYKLIINNKPTYRKIDWKHQSKRTNKQTNISHIIIIISD